jgi:hypothetical protein
VILDPVALLVLETSAIEVVSVALVLDRGVAAAGAMHVGGGSGHGRLLPGADARTGPAQPLSDIRWPRRRECRLASVQTFDSEADIEDQDNVC